MPRLVLIVEDSPQVAANLEIALGAVPEVEVRVAGSGLEALGVLDGELRQNVAAVITDLEMPRMDGFELIAKLRANPKFAHTPIIVSSGSPDPASPDKARSLGADAYFSKPYSPLALRRTLEQLIRENHDGPS